MLIALIISQILLWIALAGLALVGLALARQVGILHERTAPAGALTAQKPALVGEAAPKLTLPTLQGGTVTLGGSLVHGKSRLLLFVSPNCPICKTLIPQAKELAGNDDSLELVFAGDGDPQETQAMIAKLEMGDHPFANGAEIGMTYGVDKLPHAVLLSDHGVILARGMVNTPAQLRDIVTGRTGGVTYLHNHAIQAA
jgi:methylamine dehydrogenase accessory protein MauD